MKITRTGILLLIAVAALVVSLPSIVLAQSSPPHEVFGRASINGQAVAAGVVVTAHIDNSQVEQVRTTAGGIYRIQLNPPPGQVYAGKQVTFRIGGQTATQTIRWTSGEAQLLNLNASSNTPTPRPTARTTARNTPTPRVIQGPKGDTGATGPRGQEGAAGPQGDSGPAGPAGPQGSHGSQGPKGDLGPVGPSGETGQTGSEGPRGDSGPQGYIGQTGPQGVAGPAGPAGVQGPTGPIGSSGSFLIAIIALVVALMALLVAIGRWIWELQTG